LAGCLPQCRCDFRALRRLHLLAGRYQALVFVLRTPRAAIAPSPAALRLQLASRDGYLDVTLLKRRGRPLLEPVTLQVYPTHWSQSQVTTSAESFTTATQSAPVPAPALPPGAGRARDLQSLTTEPFMASAAHYFATMAYNNAWANHRLLKACVQLSQADFVATRTSFFPVDQGHAQSHSSVDWLYIDMLERSRRTAAESRVAQVLRAGRAV